MKGKTLAAIVLSAALGLGSSGCYDAKADDARQNEAQQRVPQEEQPNYPIKDISGKIVDIDEDSFAIGFISHTSNYARSGANFQFEHFRIEAPDGKTYKLIFPGPSNYKVGDAVNFRYRAQPLVSYRDLLNAGAKNIPTSLMQTGFFKVDGVIQR